MRAGMLAFASYLATAAGGLAQDAPAALGTAILLGDTPRVEVSAVLAPRTGQVLTLVLPDPSTPGDLRIIDAMILPGLPDAETGDGGMMTFALDVPADTPPAVGFALFGLAPEIAVAGGALRIDVTGDGVPETLSSCLTREAVQLRATSEDGTEVWQAYVPLGYDVEATCP